MVDPILTPAAVKLICGALSLGTEAVSLHKEFVKRDTLKELQDLRAIDRVAREKDRKAIESIINHSISSMEAAIDRASDLVIKKIDDQRYKELMFNFIAMTRSIETIISRDYRDERIRVELLIKATHTLEVKLEEMKLWLEELGENRTLDYCSIIGASLVISSYNCMGEEREDLIDDLEVIFRRLQVTLLDEYARIAVHNGKSIPWSDVPSFLECNQLDQIQSAFEELFASDQNKMNIKYSRGSDMGILIEAYLSKPEEVVTNIDLSITSASLIRALIEAEKAGRNRSGVLDSLNAKLLGNTMVTGFVNLLTKR